MSLPFLTQPIPGPARLVVAILAFAVALSAAHADSGPTTTFRYDDSTNLTERQTCQPTTDCAAQGKNCGSIVDNCGVVRYCGAGSGPQGCGPTQVCLSTLVCCTPTTCQAHGQTCGTLPDGCGGLLSCGTCGTGQACKAGTCKAVCPTGYWDCNNDGSLCVKKPGVCP